MKRIAVLVLAFFSSCSLQKSDIIWEIEVRSVLKLDELSPKVDMGKMVFNRSFFGRSIGESIFP